MTEIERWFIDQFYSVTKDNRDTVIATMQNKLETLSENEREQYGWYLEGVIST